MFLVERGISSSLLFGEFYFLLQRSSRYIFTSSSGTCSILEYKKMSILLYSSISISTQVDIDEQTGTYDEIWRGENG